MKVKPLLTIFTICAVTVSLIGCGKGKDIEKEKEAETKDAFDAAAYASAYLDSVYKGDSAAYAKLTGQKEEDLNTIYEENVEGLVTISLGEDENAPGSTQVSPQLREDYTALWKDVLGSTKYQVKDTQKEDDAYKITVETQQMMLYAQMSDIISGKMDSFYEAAASLEEGSTENNIASAFSELMLESYQEAMKNITYADPDTIDLTLSKGEDGSWSIPEEDLGKLEAKLLDTDAASTDFSAAEAEGLQTEATPDKSVPEDLDEASSHKVGETVTLQNEGTDAAAFTIDKVEVTQDRSEYDTSNPEKVIIITYTYQNLGMEDPLLYDEMSFRILEGETVCDAYYLQNLSSPDIAAKGGEAVTASLAYGVSGSCDEVTIYVNNSQLDQPIQVTASLS